MEKRLIRQHRPKYNKVLYGEAPKVSDLSNATMQDGLLKARCKCCSAVWIPRTLNPKKCPKCKSWLWDKGKIDRLPTQLINR